MSKLLKLLTTPIPMGWFMRLFVVPNWMNNVVLRVSPVLNRPFRGHFVNIFLICLLLLSACLVGPDPPLILYRQYYERYHMEGWQYQRWLYWYLRQYEPGKGEKKGFKAEHERSEERERERRERMPVEPINDVWPPCQA